MIALTLHWSATATLPKDTASTNTVAVAALWLALGAASEGRRPHCHSCGGGAECMGAWLMEDEMACGHHRRCMHYRRCIMDEVEWEWIYEQAEAMGKILDHPFIP